MHYSVPFKGNSDDDLRCMQAAYLMILRYFRPELEPSWEAWSEITGYEAGKGTWASAGLLWFLKNGFEVRHVSLFDFPDFVKNGGAYLIREYGSEVGNWQVEHSNLALEQNRAEALLKVGIVEKREPQTEEIKRFLQNGYLVRVLINYRTLVSKPGYVGHAVVVVGYDEKNVILHDPGLPPLPNRRVSYQAFERAWADPNETAKELDAIKYPKH